MNIGIIKVNSAFACSAGCKPITSGMAGVTVTFEYTDSRWDGLNKTAVFTAGQVTRDVLNADGVVVVPAEVLAHPAQRLSVGVYGTDVEGNLVIPTIMTPVGMILSGADPSGDESTNPDLPVWAQLQAAIEALKQDGGVTNEQIAQAVADYLSENPIEVGATEEEAAQIAQNKADIETLNREKLDVNKLPEAVQYVEQELTEEQQMQARKNLNLYYNHEEPIVLYEEPATWVGSDHAALPDGTTIGVKNLYVSIDGTFSGISFLSERLSRNTYTHQWSEYTYAYYGNPYYIADIIVEVESRSSPATKDNGIPFILYRYDIGNGDSGWLYWYDRSQFSGERIGYDLILSDADNTQTVYELIPEEYLPDSVKNPDVTEAINTALAQAKESGQFDGADGKDGEDYVLTDADKQEIAEQTAQIVDVPSDEHINDLINNALYEIENAAY